MFWLFWKHYTMDNDVAELPTMHSPKHPDDSAISARRPRNARNSFTHNATREMAALLSSYGNDVVAVFDGKLNCISLSDNWQVLSGFAAAEDMGEGVRDRIAPDHIRRVGKYLTQPDDSVRFQIKHADGNWRWCEMRCVEAGGAQYKCLLRDITELVAAQGKFEKARLEAELANKSRSEFLANMSHELRTPLNAILGFAQMMESGMFGSIGHPKYQDYTGSIQDSGTTLLSKINDLLEIANIDSGRMDLNEASTDIIQVVRQAIEFHSHRAFSEQIALRDNLPKKPVYVVVDRIRMLQVLTNVLSNAIKYNRPGGRVEILCETRKDGGIDIVIEDNGGGIPAMHLQRILEAFRQDNSFFARSRDCVGLGLALSKEIVKLHQGRIDIESESGKGTLLTICLPKERTVKVAHGTKAGKVQETAAVD